MEDLIRFDVYGKAPSSAQVDALKVLMGSGAYPSEIAARKAANQSRNLGMHILIGKGLTWLAAKIMLETGLPFDDLLIIQEGYSPEDETSFCLKHGLFYGGCLGCHVCNANCA